MILDELLNDTEYLDRASEQFINGNGDENLSSLLRAIGSTNVQNVEYAARIIFTISENEVHYKILYEAGAILVLIEGLKRKDFDVGYCVYASYILRSLSNLAQQSNVRDQLVIHGAIPLIIDIFQRSYKIDPGPDNIISNLCVDILSKIAKTAKYKAMIVDFGLEKTLLLKKGLQHSKVKRKPVSFKRISKKKDTNLKKKIANKCFH